MRHKCAPSIETRLGLLLLVAALVSSAALSNLVGPAVVQAVATAAKRMPAPSLLDHPVIVN